MPEITQVENWKPVEGYEGLYEVSDLARVRSLRRTYFGRTQIVSEKILKNNLNKNGIRKSRYRITLTKRGVKKNFYVHALVAKEWVSGWFEGAIVNHLDNDPLNNLPSNLEWTTYRGNTAHAIAIGACKNRQNQYTKLKQSTAA